MPAARKDADALRLFQIAGFPTSDTMIRKPDLAAAVSTCANEERSGAGQIRKRTFNSRKAGRSADIGRVKDNANVQPRRASCAKPSMPAASSPLRSLSESSKTSEFAIERSAS